MALARLQEEEEEEEEEEKEEDDCALRPAMSSNMLPSSIESQDAESM